MRLTWLRIVAWYLTSRRNYRADCMVVQDRIDGLRAILKEMDL